MEGLWVNKIWSWLSNNLNISHQLLSELDCYAEFSMCFKREWSNSTMAMNSNHIPLMWQSLTHRPSVGFVSRWSYIQKSLFCRNPACFGTPRSSPAPCGISDLKASLEWDPEARERQWLENSWGWCRWGDIPEEWADASVRPGPALHGHVQYWEGKGLHEFVPCLQVCHLTRYWSLALQVSQPASMLCNTMEPNCTLRTPKSCVCFLSIRYSWHKISQWLLFRAVFPLHIPTGCYP